MSKGHTAYMCGIGRHLLLISLYTLDHFFLTIVPNNISPELCAGLEKPGMGNRAPSGPRNCLSWEDPGDPVYGKMGHFHRFCDFLLFFLHFYTLHFAVFDYICGCF